MHGPPRNPNGMAHSMQVLPSKFCIVQRVQDTLGLVGVRFCLSVYDWRWFRATLAFIFFAESGQNHEKSPSSIWILLNTKFRYMLWIPIHCRSDRTDLIFYRHCYTTSHSTTPHPINRARRWYTAVMLPYDVCNGSPFFDIKNTDLLSKGKYHHTSGVSSFTGL